MATSKQCTSSGKEEGGGGESDEEIGGMILCLMCNVSTPVLIVTCVFTSFAGYRQKGGLGRSAGPRCNTVQWNWPVKEQPLQE